MSPPTEESTAIEPPVTITDDEAAIYDRQIRLWGVESQKKLRSSNVLVVGLNGLGSEIVKNIVLAGINSLTVVDHEKVTHLDSLSHLFANQAIGENRSKASEANIRQLNPMVSVTCRDDDIANLLDNKATDFITILKENRINVVIVNNVPKATAIHVNEIVRSLDTNILFYFTGSFGMFAFSIHDLGKGFKYMVEESAIPEADLADGPSGPKKSKPDEKETKISEKTLDFIPLSNVLSVVAGKAGTGLTKRTNPLVVLMHTILDYQEEHGHFPNSREELDSIIKKESEVFERLSLDESIKKKLDAFDAFKFIFGELSPICSIAGGVVAQDVIRGVTTKETPIKNVFFFNGLDMNGVVESIGMK